MITPQEDKLINLFQKNIKDNGLIFGIMCQIRLKGVHDIAEKWLETTEKITEDDIYDKMDEWDELPNKK